VPEKEQSDVYRFLHDLAKLPGHAEKHSNILHKCRKWKFINEHDIQKMFPYMNNLQRLYTCKNYFKFDLAEEFAQEWKKWETDNNSQMDMGLLKGLTSNAMLHLTYSNNINISWINLI